MKRQQGIGKGKQFGTQDTTAFKALNEVEFEFECN